MSAICDVNVIFPIYGQLGAIWKPDSGRKKYIFIKSNLLSYKNSKQNIKISNTASSHTIALSKGTIFSKKC